MLPAYIAQSAEEGCSLVHSAALSMGMSYVQVNVPPRSHGPHLALDLGRFNASTKFLQDVAVVSTLDDLHHSETISAYISYQPLVYLVRGTPLISLVGGVLIRLLDEGLSPRFRLGSGKAYVTLGAQGKALQGALHAWVHSLQSSAVDLPGYGQTEQTLLRDNVDNARGAFDNDSSLFTEMFLHHNCRIPQPTIGMIHLIPVRLLGLEVGETPEQWELIWVYEFEAMAKEFWNLIENPPMRIPGSWVE